MSCYSSLSLSLLTLLNFFSSRCCGVWFLRISSLLACFIMRLSNCYAISRALNDAIKWIRWIHVVEDMIRHTKAGYGVNFINNCSLAVIIKYTHRRMYIFYYSILFGYTIDTFRCSIEMWCVCVCVQWIYKRIKLNDSDINTYLWKLRVFFLP